MQLGKETIDSLRLYGPVTKKMADLEQEEVLVNLNDQIVKMKVVIRISALDRKAANAVSGMGGAYCDLCFLSLEQAHELSCISEDLLRITRSLETNNALLENLEVNPDTGEIKTKQVLQ